MTKKIPLIIFSIVLLFIPVSNIFASDCTNDNLSLLKNWASNVNYDYDYVESNGDATFKIRFTNLNRNVVLKDRYHDVTYSNNNSNEVIIDGFEDGKTYAFELIASDKEVTITYYVKQLVGDVFVDVPLELPGNNFSCQGEKLTTLYVTVPKYNQFYNTDICKSNGANKLCSKWYKHDLSIEEFTKEIEKSNQKELNGKSAKNSSLTIIEKIIQLYEDSPIVMYSGTLIVLIGIIAIITLLFKRKQNGFEGW